MNERTLLPTAPTPSPAARKDGAASFRPATAAALDVSVVVVNWNTREYLLRCIGSVYAETTDVTFEVIVVDNASADGSAAAVRERFPDVVLIANGENRGFAAANNQAIQVSRGRYVLLLNPDTCVLDGAIGRTVRIADVHPRLAVLGCQVLLGGDELQRTCFRFPSAGRMLYVSAGLDHVLPPSWIDGGMAMPLWDRRSARDVDVVTGAFMLVRREAIQEVGVMDEAYFVYAEETDWCFRFRRAGWRCAFTPEARIVHHDGGGKSTSQVRTRMYVQLQKSVLIFVRKHRGTASWLAAKSAYAVEMAVQAAVFAAASVFTRSPTQRARMRCALAALRFHLFGTEPKS